MYLPSQSGSIRKNVPAVSVEKGMGQADQQHLDWLARSFGQADYQPLNPSDIDALHRVGEVVSLAPGGHLFDEGERATASFLIEQGGVEIYRGEGQTRRVVARAGPGAVLGDMAMFLDRSHVANARASSPVRAIRLERSRVLPELAVQPGILMRWLVSALLRMETTQLRLLALTHKSVLAQVADLLAEESNRQPDVNLSQSTIGTLLGISRQSVNEALGRLRDQGVVETGYRRIRVIDPDRLRSIAER